MVDAVFKTSSNSSLTPAQLEDLLALINEYLVKRAAPDPLPAGSQVQIYDLAGFKLSYAMGSEVMQLFQVRCFCIVGERPVAVFLIPLLLLLSALRLLPDDAICSVCTPLQQRTALSVTDCCFCCRCCSC
jgi:hypothetical protein